MSPKLPVSSFLLSDRWTSASDFGPRSWATVHGMALEDAKGNAFFLGGGDIQIRWGVMSTKHFRQVPLLTLIAFLSRSPCVEALALTHRALKPQPFGCKDDLPPEGRKWGIVSCHGLWTPCGSKSTTSQAQSNCFGFLSRSEGISAKADLCHAPWFSQSETLSARRVGHFEVFHSHVKV